MGTRINRTFSNNIFDALFGANNPSSGNKFATILDLVNVGVGTNIFFANSYSDLPDPALFSGIFYWVANSQGTWWLPGNLGGTYYGKGLYCSNGVSWETAPVPYQATLVEVNTGLNDNKFITPYTLTNANVIKDKVKILSGVKNSSIDPGNLGELSITDDYCYICVQTGVAGSAIWKKFVLFAT